MRKNTLKGAIGDALTITIANRLKKLNYKLLAEPFILRNETDNAWRCEFWGKILRSTITCAYMTDDPELRKIADDSVADIMSSQTADGCISSYPYDLQLNGWDLWGRKYVLLGLIRYYELLNPDPAVLDCCCRMVDHLMTQVGPDKKDILACGWHNGLASASILGAIVSLYRLTGKKEYQDFAEYIIGRGASSIGNVYECCDLGLAPAVLGNGKAYEMTSCFQGLAEMAMLNPDPARKNTVVNYYNAVLAHEIFVTGTGGAKDLFGEIWYEGTMRQTRGDCGSLGETCITATWLRYCTRMLQITDDAKIADEIEKTLYNSLLGALAPDGSHWVHANPTPLTGGGFKKCADDQIKRGFGTPFDGNDCCRAQGPEGLAIASEIAVTGTGGTVTVNLFEALETEDLTITGNYPYEPQAVITFTAKTNKVLRLRTPEFLKCVTCNGKNIPFQHGEYLTLSHTAATQDEIILEFDFTLKELVSPCGNYIAVKRGPLVLAEDSRGKVPEAKVSVQWNGKELCEYAVAGNLMNESNTLTVWFKR